MRHLLPTVAVAAFATAFAVGGDVDAATRQVAALTRPATLPFLWRALGDAARSGDASECWERSKELLAATPGWADGHAVFAFRFALDGGELLLPKAQREQAAADRLALALRFLEEAAAVGGPRAAQLWSDAAWLVELAVRAEPAAAASLGEDPALRIDRCLARAEASGGGRLVREQRLYDAPRLCAAFLRAGDADRAVAFLQEVADRCANEADPALRDGWRAVLLEVRTALLPAAPADRDERRELRRRLAADPRLQSLAPFLR